MNTTINRSQVQLDTTRGALWAKLPNLCGAVEVIDDARAILAVAPGTIVIVGRGLRGREHTVTTAPVV